MAPEDIPVDPPGAGKAPKRSAAPAAESADTLVVVTLKAADGSVVKIEAVEPGGARHQMSAAEAARLVGDRPRATLQGLVHEAFEAGIAYVLDEKPEEGAASEKASGESKEDTALLDALLDALIERSAAKRLLQREVLNSALLGTIISEAAAPQAAGAE